MLNITVAYTVHSNPRNTLMVQPTLEDMQGHVKDEIEPMLRDVPVLRDLVPAEKTRDKKNTILRKRFPGMTLYGIGANSPSGFRRKKAGTILSDEVNEWPPAVGKQGDQLLLAYKRAEGFLWPKYIQGSTPTVKGESRISDIMETSDQRYYNVPCPFCGHMQVLKWANIDFSDKGTVEKPVYICESCKEAIDYKHHRWMMKRGKWIATREFTGHAGFNINALYSYSPNATWHHMVKAFLNAKGNKEKMKTWVNTWLGEDSEEEVETLDVDLIKQHRENFGRIMPLETAILTCFVDTQDDRLEVVLKAWGRDETSWTLDHIIIANDPAKKETWNALDALLQASYPHENGSTVNIHCSMIDSGGHHADEVYKFVKLRKSMNVYATKGSKDLLYPIIGAPKKRSSKSKSHKYGIDLVMVGVNTAKNLIYSRLNMAPEDPGYIHLPFKFSDGRTSDEYCDQLRSEERKPRFHKGHKYYEWIKVSPRNEAWDCEVGSVAALRKICPHPNILNSHIDRLLLKRTPKPAPVEPANPELQRIRPKKPIRGGFTNRWKQ